MVVVIPQQQDRLQLMVGLQWK